MVGQVFHFRNALGRQLHRDLIGLLRIGGAFCQTPVLQLEHPAPDGRRGCLGRLRKLGQRRFPTAELNRIKFQQYVPRGIGQQIVSENRIASAPHESGLTFEVPIPMQIIGSWVDGRVRPSA